MSFRRISKASAFSAGSQLWLMCTPEQSLWARRADWYLNFQLYHSGLRQRSKLPREMRLMIAELEIELPEIKLSESASLLVGSQGQLPNLYVLQVDYQSGLEQWLQSAYQIWNNLNQPTLRIFLPPSQGVEALESSWPEKNFFQDITFVDGQSPETAS